ncbi:unnamed protein product [Urochloa humidicola]
MFPVIGDLECMDAIEKTVDKLSNSIPSSHIPETPAEIKHYVQSSQRKVIELVMLTQPAAPVDRPWPSIAAQVLNTNLDSVKPAACLPRSPDNMV